MATKQKEYQRLPGQSSFFIVGVRSKLYLAKDHLLRVNSNGWTENYRRFYFTDIQAIVVNLTDGRRLSGFVVHFILCALCVVWLLTARGRNLGSCHPGVHRIVFSARKCWPIVSPARPHVHHPDPDPG